MVRALHKVLTFIGALVLIICTAWGGSSLGTQLAHWTHPDRVTCEMRFPSPR
jgi:hypothetical protein